MIGSSRNPRLPSIVVGLAASYCCAHMRNDSSTLQHTTCKKVIKQKIYVVTSYLEIVLLLHAKVISYIIYMYNYLFKPYIMSIR